MASRSGLVTRDTFATQQIEVYKGPSSFLFGRGSTGGVINATTKTPECRTFVENELIAPAPGGLRATMDANGQLNENVAARIAVMGQDLPKAGRENIESKRWGVAPSIKVNVNDRTRVTASYIYQRTNQVPELRYPVRRCCARHDNAFPPAAGATRQHLQRLTPGNPDVETNDAHIATLKVEHDISDQSRRSPIRPDTPTWIASCGSTSRRAARTISANQSQRQRLTATAGTSSSQRSWANQTDMVGKFQTWGLLHTFVTGVEFREKTLLTVRQTDLGLSSYNLLNPDPYPANPGTVQPTLLARYCRRRPLRRRLCSGPDQDQPLV